MNQSFKFNEDAKYRVGGVYEPTHQFSLVHQTITIKPKRSFDVRLPNIWLSYKLPLVKEAEMYDNWIANQMQFWQNQLNFAIWCATTGCGVSKLDHLRNKDPMIRSVFRFHTYYQIRRILSEMECPLPTHRSWNPLNNGIDINAFEQLCAEFKISSADFRQKLDPSKGMGAIRYYTVHTTYSHHHMRMKKEKVLETGGDYDSSRSDFTVEIPSSGKFGSGPSHVYKIEYIEQNFKNNDPMTSVGSFVLDKSSGFTQAGVARINDSIRTYVWSIVGAQSQARSSILGTGKAFDAQKQFLANVEDVINSEVDLPSSIERYQSTLQYARSKVDFVVGLGLYMIPSDMDLYIGTINGYNNLITIASDDLQLGHNDTINEEQQIQQNQFDSPPDDFELVPDDPPLQPINEPMQQEDLNNKEELQEESMQQEAMNKEVQLQEDEAMNKEVQLQEDEAMNKEVQQKAVNKTNEKFTHEENKLLLTLFGITLGSVIMWTLR